MNGLQRYFCLRPMPNRLGQFHTEVILKGKDQHNRRKGEKIQWNFEVGVNIIEQYIVIVNGNKCKSLFLCQPS
jgi:hypothetical protein